MSNKQKLSCEEKAIKGLECASAASRSRCANAALTYLRCLRPVSNQLITPEPARGHRYAEAQRMVIVAKSARVLPTKRASYGTYPSKTCRVPPRIRAAAQNDSLGSSAGPGNCYRVDDVAGQLKQRHSLFFFLAAKAESSLAYSSRAAGFALL